MAADPILHIIVPQITPRIQYVVGLVFDRILSISTTVGELTHENNAIPCINYTGQILSGTFHVPNVGLLSNAEIRPVEVEVNTQTGSYPCLFAMQDSTGVQMDFDVFSAVFFLATEYEKWTDPGRDQHDRHVPESSVMRIHELYQWPLVHHYAEQLWQRLGAFFPSLQSASRTQREFDFEITFDIDHARKYQDKPMHIQLGGLLKDILRADIRQIRERIAVWLGARDPFNTFEEIFRECPAEKTTFFFLIERRHPNDGRFTYRTPMLQRLIRSVHQRGYQIGIHPSFSTYQDASAIQQEMEALSGLIGSPVFRSRQHFLRYRLPDTFRHLIAAGIQEEFTLCAFDSGGFPSGMAIPYPWFDLAANQQTELLLHPTCIMDRSLQQYLALEPESAAVYVHDLIQKTREVAGTFTMLLHNDVLSQSGEWENWRAPVLGLIETLRNDKK